MIRELGDLLERELASPEDDGEQDSDASVEHVPDADGPSEGDISRAVTTVYGNRVKPKTKKAYQGCINHFKWWLRDICDGAYRGLLQDFEDYNLEDDDSPNINTTQKKSSTPKLFVEVEINNERLKSNFEVVERYIAWKQQYQKCKIGSLRITRSAINWYCAEHGITFSQENSTNRMAQLYSGLQRTDAANRETGDSNVTEGKVALPFTVYRWLSKKFLQERKTYDSCYSVLTWNLVCRSNNTAKIMLDHMNWENDALIIYFAVTKTDQNNKHPKDPKHIFANPYMPEICPILNLGIYLMLAGQLSNKLFDGNAVHAKFSESLRRTTHCRDGKEILAQHGIVPSDIGTHSYRKGAATYAKNGDTGGPSITALCLRAGWSMGGVQDRYIRHESAGDCFTGRVVSGLQQDTREFAILPPHFAISDWSLTEQIELLSKCFVSTASLLQEKPNLIPILFNCLASIVYHSDWLRETLPAQHPLFQTGVFQQGLVDTLKARVIFSFESEHMTATGIPGLCRLVHRLEKIIRLLSPDGELLKAIGNVVQDKLEQHSAAPLNSVQLKEVFTECLQSTGVLDAINRCRSDATAAANDSSSASPELPEKSAQLFYYDGAFNVLPKDFKFPAVPTSVAWSLWWNGNKTEKYMPIRKIKNGMLTNSTRKVLSEWRYLFEKHFEKHLRNKGALIQEPTANQVSEMYKECEHIVDKVCDSGKRKREHQLCVRTVIKRLRIYNQSNEPLV